MLRAIDVCAPLWRRDTALFHGGGCGGPPVHQDRHNVATAIGTVASDEMHLKDGAFGVRLARPDKLVGVG